ncbi:MAG: putative DNA binding domain-containing protein, partial [Anaerolineae bacterium]|nr:putative DNA binding domain-containing protein [Anaerolineae bacterium]
MNAAKVAEWLASGEGRRIEFKERYSSKVIEALVAFANTAGGQVLIGVSSRGQVVGLADADRVVESVISACREAISPPLAPTVELVRLPEGAIVAAQVQATGRMHAKGGAVFVRHGRQTRRASGEEIRLLTLRETPQMYETLPCPGATWEDLDEAALRKYLTARAPGALEEQGMSLATLAIGLKFAVQHGREQEVVVPTVAGVALFG